MLRHDVPSKGLDENGNFCVLGTARVLEDRCTKRFKPPPERNRAIHLRHIRYRGKTLEVLHKLKNCNPAFQVQIQSSSSRHHRAINTPGKKTRWAYQTALTGRRCEGINSGMGESKSIPFLHFTRRIGNCLPVSHCLVMAFVTSRVHGRASLSLPVQNFR